MLMDIFNVPAEIVIDGKTYKAEYDNKGYAMLESLTGKGIYKLYNLLMPFFEYYCTRARTSF